MERAYFLLCRTLGRLLRSTKYSNTRIVSQDGELRVRKRRLFYAPLLLWMSGPLLKLLDAGVRVLPQRDWERREREVYEAVHGTWTRIEAGGMLVVPRLPGEPLSALLENPALKDSERKTAIELAVLALSRLHAKAVTHGDATAENVVVDLESGVARWIDFELVHDSTRPLAWRRADDLRALLATCLIRTGRERLSETVHLVLDVYRDEGMARPLATYFATIFRRPLAFHLGQAALSFEDFREVARLAQERIGRMSISHPTDSSDSS
jgi:hypothetical protein